MRQFYLITSEKQEAMALQIGVIQSFFSWFLWIPIVGVCFQIRYWILGNKASNGSFSCSCIPVYLYTLIYFIIPLFSFITSFKRKREFRHFKLFLGIYFFGNIINTFISIQVALIAAKLDGFLNEQWLLIFIVLWIFSVWLLLTALMFLISYILARYTLPLSRILHRKLLGFAVIFSFFVILFSSISTTVAITATILDGYLHFSYVFAFIPLWIIEWLITSVILTVFIHSLCNCRIGTKLQKLLELLVN